MACMMRGGYRETADSSVACGALRGCLLAAQQASTPASAAPLKKALERSKRKKAEGEADSGSSSDSGSESEAEG